MYARTPVLSVFALALAAAVALPARSDDWPQFRHDGHHTGASKDRLTLPLTEVWSLPGSGGAYWHGRIFYVTVNSSPALLVCADARTGGTIWAAPLYHNSIGRPVTPITEQLAVTDGGTVFVADWGGRSPARIAVGPGSMSYDRGGLATHFVRAFRAQDGRLIDETPNARFGLVPLSQVSLVDGPVSTALDTLPLSRNGAVAGGAFLVSGEEIAWSDLYGAAVNRWTPGSPAQGFRVFHLLPVPDDHPAQLLPMGYTPTQTGGGLIVGGQFDHLGSMPMRRSLMGLFQGANFAWHWDFPWILGCAVYDQGRLFAGCCEPVASRALVALDSGSGTPVWTFPRSGPRPDMVGSGMRTEIRNRGLNPTPGRSPNGRNPGSSPPFFSTAWQDVGAGFGVILEPRLVVNDSRVFWVHETGLFGLDRDSGVPVWPEGAEPAPVHARVNDVIGAGQYLVASTTRQIQREDHHELVVLRQDSGKIVSRQEVSHEGTLAAAEGLVFLREGQLTTFAPAERTFHLAVDSDRAEDYDPEPATRSVDEAAPSKPNSDNTGDGGSGSSKASPTASGHSRALADAMTLRLTTDLPEPEMLRRIRERRRIHPELSLLLSLDWLDARRDQPIFGSRARWTDRDSMALQALCGRLIAEARPTHFDAAPDVNVYLARHPEQTGAVSRFLRGMRQEIALRSPGTQLLASFNVEVLRGVYGNGDDRPFGRLTLPTEEKQKAVLDLWGLVDEIGLTTFPQSAFRAPVDMPGDYLFALKPLIGDKHILITRIVARLPKDTPEEQTRQASFLKHVVQATYWLDASLIAYPDAVSVTKPDPKSDMPDFALLNPAGDRLSAAVWRDTLSWKRVQRLSAPAAAGPR